LGHQLPASPLNPVTTPGAAVTHVLVVAVGASAGGLHALSTILAALPADFPVPIVVVQHLAPYYPSKMALILNRRTPLHVKRAKEGDHLRAGWVYVAPPARHLLIRPDGTLTLTATPRVHHCRPSVDVFFQSLAASVGARAVGVILTGADGDGADGVQAIRAAGGVTIVQDEPSSQFPYMPRAAVETGCVDYVLPLDEIAPKLIALTRTASAEVKHV